MMKRFLLAIMLPLMMAVAPCGVGVMAQTFRSIPYLESFEQGMNGWTVVDGDGDGLNWRAVDFSLVPPLFVPMGYFAHDGSVVLYSESADDTGALHPNNWVVSPIFEMPASISDSLRFSWWVKSFSTTKADRYEVRIGTVSSVYDTVVDTAQFTDVRLLDTVSFTSYQQRSVSLTGYEGMLVRVAFCHTGPSGSSLQIDYVSVGNDSLPVVAIEGPLGVDLYDTVTYTARLLHGSTDGLSFMWICDSADYNENPTADTTRLVWVQGGVMRLGLAAQNAYGSDTAWINVAVSNCGTIDALPFVESFADTSLTRSCWKMVDGDGNGTAWTLSNGWAESNSITFFGIIPMADNWLITPPIALGENLAQLLWQVRPKNTDYPNEHYSVYVGTGSDVYDLSAYTLLFDETLTPDTAWQTRYLPLADYYGDTVRIAFRHHLTDDQEALQLTAVRVETAGAPIIALHAPARVIAGDTAFFRLDTFSVSPIQSIMWRVQTDSAGSYDTLNASATLAYAWPASTPVGDYWVYADVTNNEGTTTDSALVHLHVCETVVTLPYHHSFDGTDEDCWRIGEGWYVNDSINVDGVPTAAAVSFSHNEFGDDLQPDNLIASPYLLIPDSGYELRYIVTEAPTFFSDYANDRFNVIVRHSGTADTIYRGAVGTNDLQRGRLYLGAYAGDTIQIAFHHFNSPSGYALQLAEVEVTQVGEPVLSINLPARARVGEPVSITASVVSSEVVDYYWSLSGANPPSAVTPSVTAQWDVAGTYDIVLTVTSPLYGNYYDTAQITVIECSGIDTLPYVEHFDIDRGCWQSFDLDGDGYGFEMALGGSATDFIYAGAMTYGSVGNALVSWSTRPTTNLLSFALVGDGVALDADNLLLSPAITLPDSGEWRFQFQAASAVTRFNAFFPNLSDGLDSFEVLATTLPLGDQPRLADFDVLMPMQTTDSLGFSAYTVSLNDYRGQTVHLAVRHRATGKVGLLLDEFSIYEELPELYTVTVVSDNPNMGRVSGGGMVAEGDTVTIRAIANPGYHFVQWNDQSTDSVRVVTVYGDVTYTAYFAANVGIDGTDEKPVIAYASNGCIVVEGADERHTVQIFDISGRLVASRSARQCRYPIPHAGVYFVKVGPLPVQKVVVVH